MTRRKKSTYHHGGLRNVLLLTAQEIIENEGWQSLSLRKVARVSGVSHTAPYHHFPDKMALLAGVAENGFRLLTEKIETSENSSLEGPVGLKDAALTYILFSHSHPQLYRLMFSFDFGEMRVYPELLKSSFYAFNQIINRLYNFETENEANSYDLREIATASWSMVHGLSMLLIDNQLESLIQKEEDIKPVMERMLNVLWTGIANLP